MKESGDLLEAAFALGIDMQRIHYGAESIGSPSGEILVNIDNIGSKSKQMRKAFDQKITEGKQIVFVKKGVDKRHSTIKSVPGPDLPNTQTQVPINRKIPPAATEGLKIVSNN